MIPTISPPTDNLYKFVALFGLGIFILGNINMSAHRSDLIKSKIQVEEIQKNIFDSLFQFQTLDIERQFELQGNIIIYEHVDDMVSQLDILEAEILASEVIPEKLKNQIVTDIDIIEIQSSMIHRTEKLNNLMLLLSIGLIIVGFTLWYLKDQRWQDKNVKTPD